MAWQVQTTRDSELPVALPLIDIARQRGFAVERAVMDKGYDVGPIHDGCEDRGIRLRRTPAVVAGDTSRRPANTAGVHTGRRANLPLAA